METRRTMKPGVLTRQFSVEAFAGPIVKLADINGDGQQEMLMLQTAGQLKSELYKQRPDLDDVDRALYCLTAVTLAGEVLWQDGEPYDRPEIPFTQHGGSNMLLVDDVDADGNPEVVVIRGQDLAILDAATGTEKAAVGLPSDNFVSLFTAQFGDPAAGRQIICKVNDQAYAPWQYSNPTIVYNANLSLYHEPFAVRGAGHNMVPMDVNGDGRDELFIGYSLLDHNLNEIWKLDLGADFDYVHDHADAILVHDMNGDGKPEVQYAGSEDFFVTDFDGNILWTAHAGHSQQSVTGPWGPNGETRIIMSEKNRGLWGMDTDGNILWNRTDINGYAVHGPEWSRGPGRTNWAIFRPQLKPITPIPFESDPSWSRDLWPSFIDGDGTLVEAFPWDNAYAQPKRLIRASRSYDCGVLYHARVHDLDGDGLDEVIIFDRYNVWIFHSQE